MSQKIRKVTDMCITEYNEEETLQAIGNEKFAEGRAEGIAEGRAEGRVEGKAEDIERIKQMVEAGIITSDVAETVLNNLKKEDK
ncbi:MAG: hypothetical protein K5865_04205 [Eubacterium sp.]|nr:hypothetical protein [Eubacterium sp.]